jgi:exopolysaccharide production protein ExoZ
VYKLSSLQVARGLAALFVVAFHSIYINAKYVEGDSILPELFVFGQTGVDLFFVLSGFVMIVAFRNKFGARNEIPGFLKARFFRIYPTYWVYLLAVFLVFIVRPEIVNNSQAGNVDLFSSFLLLPQDAAPLVMVAWSLIHEVWFYLVFAMILMLPARLAPAAFIAWLVAIVSASLFLTTPDDAYLRVMMHEFSVEFIFGALAGFAYLKASADTASNRATLAVLALTGFAGLAYAVSNKVVGSADVIQSVTLERVFAVGGGYTLLLLVVALAKPMRQSVFTKVFAFVGDISYSLYLSHILTLSVCGRVWMALGYSGGGLFGSVLFWSLSYVAVIAVAFMSYHLIERNVMQLSKRVRVPVFQKASV